MHAPQAPKGKYAFRGSSIHLETRHSRSGGLADNQSCTALLQAMPTATLGSCHSVSLAVTPLIQQTGNLPQLGRVLAHARLAACMLQGVCFMLRGSSEWQAHSSNTHLSQGGNDDHGCPPRHHQRAGPDGPMEWVPEDQRLTQGRPHGCELIHELHCGGGGRKKEEGGCLG